MRSSSATAGSQSPTETFWTPWLWLVAGVIGVICCSQLPDSRFQLLAFRFTFAYWLLFSLPSLLQVPVARIFPSLLIWYQQATDAAVRWIATKWLGIERELIPIGSESGFEGVVDLITMQAVYFHGEQGQHVVRTTIPETLEASARESRLQLLAALSKLDDQLLECLLNDVEPSEEDLHRVIRRAILGHQLTPVLVGSAYRNKGVQEVLTAVTRYLPSPADRQVFAIDLRASAAESKGSAKVSRVEPAAGSDSFVCRAEGS